MASPIYRNFLAGSVIDGARTVETELNKSGKMQVQKVRQAFESFKKEVSDLENLLASSPYIDTLERVNNQIYSLSHELKFFQKKVREIEESAPSHVSGSNDPYTNSESSDSEIDSLDAEGSDEGLAQGALKIIL